MNGFRIEPARREDLDAITALEAEAFPSPWRRDFFESELDAGGRLNLVAHADDGTLCGYLFSMWFLEEMHINKIAVAESWRRRGVASRLMEICSEFARERGVTSLSLEVRATNAAAQHFYESLHFVPAYRRRDYYPDGEDAIVMTAAIVSNLS